MDDQTSTAPTHGVETRATSVPPRDAEYELGDLISDTWELFQRHFSVIALTVLVISVPLHLIQSAFVDYNVGGKPLPLSELGLFGPSAWLLAALAGLVGVVIPLAVARLVDRLRQGQDTDFQTALKLGFQKWGVGLITMMLLGILLVLLFLLLIIPGVIFGVFWIFAVIVVALTDKQFFEALRYSQTLVRGRWWKLFGYVLLMAIISGLVLWVIGLVFGLFGNGYVTNVLNNIASDLVSSFFIVAGVLLFRNLQHVVGKQTTDQPHIS